MKQKITSNAFSSIALSLALICAQPVFAQEKQNGYPDFEDSKMWIYEDGSAKVLTFDGVEATMPLKKVARYLKKYKGYNTTRMSIRIENESRNLSSVMPLAKQLKKAGIKVAVANNDDMFKSMTMPEYRRAYIYDEGDGYYKFELNCNNQNRIRRGNAIGINSSETSHKDITMIGDLKLMKKWISMFDGHGIAIFPEDMPYSDVQQMAETAWKSGKGQVSLITADDDMFRYTNYPNYITLIPQNSDWDNTYPGLKATDVVKKRKQSLSAASYETDNDRERIERPQTQYNTNTTFFYPEKVISNDKELVLIVKATQQNDLWITGKTDLELRAGGKTYKQTGYKGLDGFEDVYFWAPISGSFNEVLTFEPIPADVASVDIYDSNDNSLVIKGLEVSGKYRNIEKPIASLVSGTYIFNFIGEHDMTDVVTIDRAEFSSTETILYMNMSIMEPHSFKGHVGSDFTLTFPNGKKLEAIRYEGVKTDVDFDRGGDHVTTYFQIIFPHIPEEEWPLADSSDIPEEDIIRPVLEGTLCHEKIKMNLVRLINYRDLIGGSGVIRLE
mgnify:FL=1